MGQERGPISLVSTTEELLDRKVAAPVLKTENTAVGIRHADHVAPSIRKSWQSLPRQVAVALSVQFARGLRPWSLGFLLQPLLAQYAMKLLCKQTRTEQFYCKKWKVPRC
jgi:hypothetical protein